MLNICSGRLQKITLICKALCHCMQCYPLGFHNVCTAADSVICFNVGYLLETEYGLCKYINSQMITIQELPELAPPGLLPRSFEVILEDDLVDRCKPGDRIYATGIYKALVPRYWFVANGDLGINLLYKA